MPLSYDQIEEIQNLDGYCLKKKLCELIDVTPEDECFHPVRNWNDAMTAWEISKLGDVLHDNFYQLIIDKVETRIVGITETCDKCKRLEEIQIAHAFGYGPATICRAIIFALLWVKEKKNKCDSPTDSA